MKIEPVKIFTDDGIEIGDAIKTGRVKVRKGDCRPVEVHEYGISIPVTAEEITTEGDGAIVLHNVKVSQEGRGMTEKQELERRIKRNVMINHLIVGLVVFASILIAILRLI